MDEVPTSIKVTQTLGITTAAVLSGAIASLSYKAMPGLLLAPGSLAVQQWQTMYARGVRTAPPLAGFALLNFVYLSYRHYHATLPSLHDKWTGYAVAGLSTIAIVPYTLVVMADVNGKLHALANRARSVSATTKRPAPGEGEAEGADEPALAINEANAKQLLDHWGMLNLGRSVFPLVGAVVGVWAAMTFEPSIPRSLIEAMASHVQTHLAHIPIVYI